MLNRKASCRSRRFACLAAQVIAVGAPAIGWGGVSFNSGSVTWSWDADTASTNGGKTTFVIAPPSASTFSTAPLQLNRTGTAQGSSSTGRGSMGHVTNATTATFAFRSGTGVTQADPDNLFTGVSVTKAQFGGLFDATSGGFGPTATGFFSLTVGGTAGVNGYSQVVGDLVFRLNGATGSNLRTPIAFSDTFNGGAAPTPFSKTYTYSLPFNPTSIPAGQKVYVGGSLTFISSNQTTTSDIVPIQFEAGGAPPTATYFGTGTSSWNDISTWTPPQGSFIEPGADLLGVPNGVGIRARIAATGTTGTTEFVRIDLANPVTLGALHVDNDRGVRILSNAGHGIRFETNGGDATIVLRNPEATSTLDLALPLTLANPLSLHVEGRGNAPDALDDVTFNAPITLASLPVVTQRGVTLAGNGGVTFNAPNAYNGPTRVTGNARLDAAVAGSLSNTPTFAEGGLIRVSNNQAQVDPSLGINARSGGQVDLNVASLGALRFDISPGAVISGSATELTQLVVGGNLQIGAGGVIGHETFDIDRAVGNPQGLPPTPTYIFGISADFSDNQAGSITVGTQSRSPWIGFGADKFTRRFGSDPTSTGGPRVIVAGDGTLSAATGGRLELVGQLVGSGRVDITGGGVVVLMNADNDFDGAIVVRPDGSLRINGDIQLVNSVTIEGGGRLGGFGRLGGANFLSTGGADAVFGNVTLADQSVLEPGDPESTPSRRVAELTIERVITSPQTLFNFDFGGDASDPGGLLNDRLIVLDDITLDGELLVNQLQFFDTQTEFPFIRFFGDLTDNGLEISPLSQEINGLPPTAAASIRIDLLPGGGGTVFLVVPEPGSATAAALLAAACLRRRRGRRNLA